MNETPKATPQEFAHELIQHHQELVALLARYPVEVVWRGHRRVFCSPDDIDHCIERCLDPLTATPVPVTSPGRHCWGRLRRHRWRFTDRKVWTHSMVDWFECEECGWMTAKYSRHRRRQGGES